MLAKPKPYNLNLNLTYMLSINIFVPYIFFYELPSQITIFIIL